METSIVSPALSEASTFFEGAENMSVRENIVEETHLLLSQSVMAQNAQEFEPTSPPPPVYEVGFDRTINGFQIGRGREAGENEDNDEGFFDVRPPGERFAILDETSRYYNRFQMRGMQTTLLLRGLNSDLEINPIRQLENAIRDIHTYLSNSCSANDYIGITVETQSLSRGAIWLSFRPVNSFNFDDLWGLIYRASQSNTDFNINNPITIHTNVVRPLRGTGRVKLTHENVFKRSILRVRRNKGMCLPRSLVVARVYAERGNERGKNNVLHKKWNSVRRYMGNFQSELAEKLTRDSGVRVPSNGCGINEIRKFQNFLAKDGIALVIYKFKGLGRGDDPMYDGTDVVLSLKGSIVHTLRILYLEKMKHYRPILNIFKATGSQGYCIPCNKSYRHEQEHRCSNRCPSCFAKPPCIESQTKQCKACLRTFLNEECYRKHLENGSYIMQRKKKISVCEGVRICKQCFRIIKVLPKNRLHKCGEGYCSTCQCMRPYNHLCFMPQLKNPKIQKKHKLLFIFYDFESRQDSFMKGDRCNKIHVPTLCVTQQVCTDCLENNDLNNICPTCGVHEFVFKENPVKQFVEFSIRPSTNFTRIICIAHNSKGYDAQFILQYLVNQGLYELPKLIMNGTKIMSMKIGSTVFLDSLNYFHMPLSALPKAFGFSDTSKGLFPHLFNTKNSQNYIGPLPPLEFYSPDTMTESNRKSFIQWYEEMTRNNYVFDFQKEIASYCKLDVDILRRACLEFRSIFIKYANVDPFDNCITIASACMNVFRKNYLKIDTIAVLPAGGYRNFKGQSRKAMEWLLWQEHLRNCKIIHAANGREFRIKEGYRVDGYFEDSNQNQKYVFQFHGCFWHGCPRCFRVNRNNNISSNESMDDRLFRTHAMSEKIKFFGYILIEKWECDFDREKANSIEIIEFLKTKTEVLAYDPLDPRDAFYGGRTGNTARLCETENSNRKIHYVDVCSLYPYICKNGKFPIGHPKVYVGDDCKALTDDDNNIDKVEGFIKCVILPPRKLYHPILPVRMHNRLLFPLCRTCCQEQNNSYCTHETQSDREIEGTWVSDEIKKAIEMGYEIKSIHEIWQYNTTKFNQLSNSGGLFVEYINTFLKIKQEASGWPSHCVDEKSKNDYITQYKKEENITLEYTKIEKNPGLRSLAKMCLNSLWGKFGQRENLTKTEIINTQKRFMELFTSPEIEITGILAANDRTVYLSWLHKDECIDPSPIVNVSIAAYVTAQARIHLYTYLQGLQERVLYYDTDSCIYYSEGKPNEYTPKTGCFLGQLTDELECYGAGSYIKAFASGGPKFYAFIVCKPDGEEVEVCKIKGITLNYKSKKLINFSWLRSYIQEGNEDSLIIDYDCIRRTDFHEVITRNEKKICKPVYKKRWFVNNMISYPYGYKNV